MSSDASQIKTFFRNQTIFLTGGSGFLGKVLIEKLLRECYDLEKIYVLMRPKKNKTPEERFEELFNFACFERLRANNEDAKKKVFLMNGDCRLPLLGLSEEDVKILIKETTCVVHAAANVKFDQTLKEATCHLKSTRDLLEMARKMTNLKVFVYVSTAFSNCLNSHIREDFYEPPIKAEKILAVIDALDDQTLQSITPQLLDKWPNTYVYSKAISEDLVRRAGHDLPITVIRPAIVFSTISEPMPGWIDNFYGVVGVVAAAGLGVLRSLHGKLDAKAYMVPVDLVANCLLAAAYKRTSSATTTIYNFVGHKKNLLTWREFMTLVEPHCWAAATEKVLWYYCFKVRENYLWHKTCVFFLHTVQAYVVDLVLVCIGRPPLAVKNYQRLDKMIDLISFFSTRSWTFDDDNVGQLWDDMNESDRKLFAFDMENMDWDQFLHDSCMGARMHLFKDSSGTVPKARRKLKILFVAHYTVVALLWYLLYKFVVFLWGMAFAN